MGGFKRLPDVVQCGQHLSLVSHALEGLCMLNRDSQVNFQCIEHTYLLWSNRRMLGFKIPRLDRSDGAQRGT